MAVKPWQAYLLGLITGLGVVYGFHKAQKPYQRWLASKHLDIGKKMLQAKDYAGAMLEYERAAAMSGGGAGPGMRIEAEARFQIASLCLALNQPIRASQEFKQVATQFPGSAWADDAFYMMIQVYDRWLNRPDLTVPALKDYLSTYVRGKYRKILYERLIQMDKTFAPPPRSPARRTHAGTAGAPAPSRSRR